MAITPQDRRHVRNLWRKILKETGPDIARALQMMVDAGQGDAPVNNPSVIVSQNMLRICLEEAIGESSRALLSEPRQAKSFLVELGLRLAGYCISAAPLEDQAEMAEAMGEALPRTVTAMRAKGFVIRCEWNFGNGWEPNLPAGGMQ